MFAAKCIVISHLKTLAEVVLNFALKDGTLLKFSVNFVADKIIYEADIISVFVKQCKQYF